MGSHALFFYLAHLYTEGIGGVVHCGVKGRKCVLFGPGNGFKRWSASRTWVELSCWRCP